MGKFLETRYSNVQQRVVKKASKAVSKLQKDFSQKDEVRSYSFQKIKRKIGKLSSNLEPPEKKNKIQHEESGNTIESRSVNAIFKTNVKNDYVHLEIDKEIDIFCDDELRSIYTLYTKFNFLFHIYDEICLEGLDGITIEALWKRISIALKYPTYLDIIKSLVWKIICLNTKIKFYKLPMPRKELAIHNRHINLELGIIIDKAMPDIYEHANINGKLKNVPDMGSCATYETREDVTELIRSLPLAQTSKMYQNALVIVADQELRINALYDVHVDPNIEISPIGYCVLERIGRSRELGQHTQGANSLSTSLNTNAKSVFHYQKNLVNNGLISKQVLVIKCPITGQNKNGSLLHLMRFYNKKKSKNLLIAEAIINKLKKSPDYRLEYNKLKAMFNIGYGFKKVLRNPELRKYLNFDTIPYRELYPDAKKSEWMLKNKNQEKQLTTISLKDPYVNISACWSDVGLNAESSDEEDEIDDSGDLGSRTLNIDAFRDVYMYILSKGPEGSNTKEISSHFAFDKFTLRSIFKKLVTQNVIDTKLKDVGKARLFVYFATIYSRKAVNERPFLDLKFEIPGSSSNRIIERQKLGLKRLLDSQGDLGYSKKQHIEENASKYVKPEFLPIILNRPSVMCEYIAKTYSSTLSVDAWEVEPPTKFNCLKKPFPVRLVFMEFDVNEINNIIDIWITFNPNNIEAQKIMYCVGECYSIKRDVEYLTVGYLLKAFLGEIQINSAEVLSALNSNWDQVKVPNKPLQRTKFNIGALQNYEEKLDYMVKPVKVFQDRSDDIDIEILMSLPPKSYVSGNITNYKHADKSVTDRMMKRILIVLDVINETRVFEDLQKMVKVIQARELEEGYKKKIDRKCLARLYRKLVLEGYIKIYKVTMNDKTTTRSQIFVCHPSISYTHSYIQSVIEQIKFKFFSKTDQSLSLEVNALKDKVKIVSTRSPFIEDDVLQSISEIRKLNRIKINSIKSKYHKTAGKNYGYKQKFIRMNILHELLFYLIYDLPVGTQRLTDAEVLDLFHQFQINLSSEDLKTMPPIYCKEISWKMFIPPLPLHLGWEHGWALLCDIILRIPFSIMLKIHNVPFQLEEITEILQHPIKRYYMMRDHPETVTAAVMYMRKYIFNIYEIVCRLAYCGLVQFGPSRYKQKDQMFMYLNRRASLLDTTTSEHGYHKVSVQEYRKLEFFFNSLNDVSQYWSSMHDISVHTRLSSRNIVKGKTITLMDVTCKPDLMRALSAKTPDEVLKYDNGHIPGDQRGAAGIDSSMWTHISKNWFWSYSNSKEDNNSVSGLKEEKLEKIPPRVVGFQELYEPVQSTKVYLPKVKATLVKANFKIGKNKKWRRPVSNIKSKGRLARRKREYYDSVDKAIIKKNPRLRLTVNWTEAEDRALYFIKFATMFISPKPHKQLIWYTVIRDVLHRMVPVDSADKTSRACQRRLRLLFKDEIEQAKMQANVANLLKLGPVAEYFSAFVSYYFNGVDAAGRRFKPSESEMQTAFIFLMSYIASHQKEVSRAMEGSLQSVDHFSPLNLPYSESNLMLIEDLVHKFKDASNSEDINNDVVKSVIISSLSNKNDETGPALQLFNIYQKYSDVTIKSAIHELKEAQVMSYKKLSNFKHTIPYQLSSFYVYTHSTTFAYSDVEEAFDVFCQARRGEVTVGEEDLGRLIGLAEIISFCWPQIKPKINLPHYPMILNPDIDDHSEVIEELAKRYLVRSSGSKESGNTEVWTNKLTTSEVSVNDEESESIAEGAEENAALKEVEDVREVEFDDDMDIPLEFSSDDDLEGIAGLKSWIHDCLDSNRVRSPSPELLNFKQSTSKHVSMEADELNAKANSIKAEPGSILNVEEGDFTLEEIMEGMVRETDEAETRRVPYILDLTDLLEADPADLDEVKLMEKMKAHFVPQFPYLEGLFIEDMEGSEMIWRVEDRMASEEVWDQIQRAQIIGQPRTTDEVINMITINGGISKDIELTRAVIDYAFSKGVLGVSAIELKTAFAGKTGNCLLEFIVKTLVDCNILLRSGIKSIYFVHHSYRSNWLVESFVSSYESSSEDTKEMEIKTKFSERLRLRLYPWTRVDGTYNKPLFKVWITNVLSYCVEYPKVTMSCLCSKFNLFKPVDIFFLLEILQYLHCVEIFKVPKCDIDAFSNWNVHDECRATFLDDFEEMFVQPTTIAFVSLGSFFKCL
ncbi:general transcription factor 3C polypeptide 1 [Cylas formicarius]|uniref:general transcription factor 3C polypeptide 1 n=1 Tax=Cylas formicarius TaxID=197179 RepID=UPI002958CC2B|nr:general transcription factor 3C polypeptide 1 [Cylas formicarius]